MKKIVADEHIPLLKGVLEPYAEVVYAPARAIDAAMVRDADALLIRTRTRCDAQLLEGSSVKFIGTATIGTDHIDLEYCGQKNITVASAAGCNAGAVMQYVARTLVAIEEKTKKDLRDCTLGIIGVGHVGRLVYKVAKTLGLRVVLNDPPLAEEEKDLFISLDNLLCQADIVTIHVPLLPSTEKMANSLFFERMKKGAAFINTSRGEVVDETALLHYRTKLSFVAIDVWCNEPHINLDLINAVDIATPHIAGYSIQGKIRSTHMVIQRLADFFNIESLKKFHLDCPLPIMYYSSKYEDDLRTFISKNYPIFEDDKLLRSQPQNFEFLRNKYKLRNEFMFKEMMLKSPMDIMIMKRIDALFPHWKLSKEIANLKPEI